MINVQIEVRVECVPTTGATRIISHVGNFEGERHDIRAIAKAIRQLADGIEARLTEPYHDNHKP